MMLFRRDDAGASRPDGGRTDRVHDDAAAGRPEAPD